VECPGEADAADHAAARPCPWFYRRPKMNRKKSAIICLLLAPFVAVANPSPNTGPYGAILGLLAEVLVVTIVLGTMGYDPFRFMYGWAGVTIVTFLMLFGGFYAVGSPGKFTSHGWGLAFFLFAELLIVVVEAIVMSWMTRLRFFRGRRESPLSFGESLRLSLLVNVVSFLSVVL